MNRNLKSIAAVLYDYAESNGVLEALRLFGKNISIKIHYSDRFEKESIENLQLSVRSRNGLRRAELDTIEKLNKVIMSDDGIEKIRNLGKKSVNEIKTCLLLSAYERLSTDEKKIFWYEMAEGNPRVIR